MTSIRLERLTPAEVDAILGPRPTDARWADDYPTEGDVQVATWLREGSLTFPTTDSPWAPWQVVSEESDLAIGGIGFHSAPDESGTVEIGYGIAATWQGRGAATLAVAAVLAVAARGGARTVVAGTDADNPASMRVLEKCGFTRTADDGAELRWALVLPDSAT